jgi:ubiquinone/menaquinone biosynthesis C-methylase UbiE
MKNDGHNFSMAKLPPLRRLLKLFHFEGIPWPCSVFYNSISTTSVFQRHYELIARDILSYCAEGSLLDIGTGPGWLLVKLQQHSPEMQLVGIDASPSMVAKARKNMIDAGLSDVIEVKEGNASNIPFADSSFDIFVSTGSIHHWKTPTTALNDVYRVLKPGAYALMYDLVSNTPASLLDEMAREFGKLKTMMFWLHSFEEPFYTRENFESLSQPTLFKKGQTQFVGVLCCLILRKEAATNLKDIMPTKIRNT